eukprot:3207365-Amphidinium_carterae.1
MSMLHACYDLVSNALVSLGTFADAHNAVGRSSEISQQARHDVSAILARTQKTSCIMLQMQNRTTTSLMVMVALWPLKANLAREWRTWARWHAKRQYETRITI